MDSIIVYVVMGVRILVAGAFVLSLVVAFSYSAIRRGYIKPFGWWANLIRRWSEPLLRPIERRLVRAGSVPNDAPAWLAGITLVGGLVVVGMLNWLISFAVDVYESAQAGALLELVARTAFELLKLALTIRVLSSWVSISPHSRFMRLIYGLTDWIVEPIRRIVPTVGMLDFSPLIAWVVLSLSEQMVMRGFF